MTLPPVSAQGTQHQRGDAKSMSLLDELNEEQREAAETIEGPVLIFAGAGSGKTRALTYRIAHMIKGRNIPPERILAVTFTNKAADAMKERIDRLIGKQAKGVWAGTFHSMCARILRIDGAKIGIPAEYSIFDEADQLAVVKDVLARSERAVEDAVRTARAKDAEEQDEDQREWTARDVLDEISSAKNELMGPDEYRRTRKGRFEQKVAIVYRQYQDRLERNKALDFDDLLMKTVELLDKEEGVREKYQRRFRYVLVDEYQDINHAQFRFVQLLAEKHGNLCVVGDDDQSIYGWRGANVRIILDFQEHFPDAKVIKLERNYRSTGKIIECAWEVIRQNENRADKRLWTHNPPGDNLVLYEAINEEEEAEWVAQTIADQVKRKLARYGDYAVLYRVNAMSRNFEQELARLGMPYEIIGGVRFYERAEIKDAIAYLRAIFNPADDLSLRRIINRPRRGIGDTTVGELTSIAMRDQVPLLDACRIFAADEDRRPRARHAVRDFYDMMARLRARAEHASLRDLVRAVVEDTDMIGALKASGNAEDAGRVENLQEFVTVAASFERRNPEAGLAEFLEHIALISDIDQAEELDGAVSLMTLHSAKGLEFPVVFIVGMEQGMFPHERSMGDEFEMEEERRLCYVGMTRAEKMLYLSHAFHRTVFGETRRQIASRFLSDLPEELVDRRQQLSEASQPRMLVSEEKVLEEPTGGRRLDVTEILARAKRRATAAAAEEDQGEETAAVAETEQSESDQVPVFATGDNVKHPKFGRGTVVTTKGEGTKAIVTVAFRDGGGVKKLVAAQAKLTKV